MTDANDLAVSVSGQKIAIPTWGDVLDLFLEEPLLKARLDTYVLARVNREVLSDAEDVADKNARQGVTIGRLHDQLDCRVNRGADDPCGECATCGGFVAESVEDETPDENP